MAVITASVSLQETQKVATAFVLPQTVEDCHVTHPGQLDRLDSFRTSQDQPWSNEICQMLAR